MEAELLEAPETQNMDVVKLNVSDTVIAQLKNDYMGLTIAGVEDKAGFKKVYDARQHVKQTRVGVEKYSKGLKEKAIAWQKKVNNEQNRVCAELEAIESHLQAEEDRIEAEKESIRKAKEAEKAALIQGRIDALANYGFKLDYAVISVIDDAGFDKILATAKTQHEQELADKAKAEELAKAEATKLEAEKKQLQQCRHQAADAQKIIDENNARIKKEQEEKEAALLAEQEKIEAEKSAIEERERKVIEDKRRADEFEKARKESAEKARLQAIEDAKKAEEKRVADEVKAKAKAERQAALRPDKEKLLAFSNNLPSLINFQVKDEKAQAIVAGIQSMIGKMQTYILEKIEEL